MAGFFVLLEEDETLHSVLARYSTYSNYDGNAINIKFFGKKNLPTKLDLPSNLKTLISNIQNVSNLSISEIIENHSLWPLYKSFIPMKRRNRIFDLMLNGEGTIYTSSGVNASKMKKNKVNRYCPLCYIEDIQRLGFAYWHRIHQVPEVEICVKHDCYLHDCPQSFKLISRTSYIDIGEVNNLVLTPRLCSSQLTIGLCNSMIDILKGKSQFDIDKICYLDMLQTTKYLKGHSINNQKIVADFISYYSSLRKSNLTNTAIKWLPAIIRRPMHYFHPLKHVMVHNFILEIKTNCIVPSIHHPFGLGPWPCINSAAEHFNSCIIDKVELHKDSKSKRIIGVFKCSCEMVYSKSVSIEGNDLADKPKIKEWGNIWQNAIKVKHAEGMSYRSIAKIFRTDAATISKYLNTQKPLKKDKSILEEERAKFRVSWIQTVNSFTENRIIQSRKKHPELYQWLYKYDREWMLVHNKLCSKTINRQQLRIDWKQIDETFSKKLSETAILLKEGNFQGKISKNVIINAINGQSYLTSRNLKKLPESFSKIDQHTESKEDYAKRRIDFALKHLQSKRDDLLKWKVMRKAGVTKNASPIVLKYLDKAIKIAS